MTNLADTLSALAAMPPAALRAEWRRIYREPAPAFSADLLVRGIAYRLQEKANGALAPAIERELAHMDARGSPPARTSAATATPRLGTRLVRSWNGQTYSVLVTDAGYRYNDQTYSSLTSIATAITGTKWSGPRFFGLKLATGTTGTKGGIRG